MIMIKTTIVINIIVQKSNSSEMVRYICDASENRKHFGKTNVVRT